MNFIARLRHSPIVQAATSVADKRAAAEALVGLAAQPPRWRDGGGVQLPQQPRNLGDDANGVTNTGVDDIDLWVGGLAEKPFVFGGMLGSTFNYVFETRWRTCRTPTGSTTCPARPASTC